MTELTKAVADLTVCPFHLSLVGKPTPPNSSGLGKAGTAKHVDFLDTQRGVKDTRAEKICP